MKLHKALNRMREMHEAYDHARREDNKQLTAWRDEVIKLREQNRVLASLLAKAQPHVCSMLCPSVKREGDPWTHKDLCTHITAALTATSQPHTQHDIAQAEANGFL